MCVVAFIIRATGAHKDLSDTRTPVYVYFPYSHVSWTVTALCLSLGLFRLFFRCWLAIAAELDISCSGRAFACWLRTNRHIKFRRITICASRYTISQTFCVTSSDSVPRMFRFTRQPRFYSLLPDLSRVFRSALNSGGLLMGQSMTSLFHTSYASIMLANEAVYRHVSALDTYSCWGNRNHHCARERG